MEEIVKDASGKVQVNSILNETTPGLNHLKIQTADALEDAAEDG